MNTGGAMHISVCFTFLYNHNSLKKNYPTKMDTGVLKKWKHRIKYNDNVSLKDNFNFEIIRIKLCLQILKLLLKSFDIWISNEKGLQNWSPF